MIRFFRSLVLIIVSAGSLNAQTIVTDALLKAGIEELRVGETSAAAETFRSVLKDATLEPFHNDALYWLVRTEIGLARYDEAAEYADRFVAFYPGDERVSEINYHQGRLLFLQGEPAKAVVALGNFIEDNPRSNLVSSAHYWIGEALVDLGRLEEADAVFGNLVEEFPYSVKREAARYRRSEIALLYRERELLDILRWSHEEYLQDAEDFYRRELEYQNAVSAYQERLGDGTRAEQRLLYLERLLDAKERLLKIRQYYVEELMRLHDES